jgi:site-specific DNA-methyltransferase (adenine-specific)
VKIKNGEFWLGDCLELMRDIPDGSVDMVLCDLPYGTTACAWDSVIPFEPLWEQYWRVCKPNAAVVLTAAQPFTSALVMSQIKRFKYGMVWDKVNRYTGALQANKRPLRRHEDVCVFSRGGETYNKQFRQGKPYSVKRTGGHGAYHGNADKDVTRLGVNDGNHNPCSVIEIKADVKTEMGKHPTQKPVALFEYLIRTYTNPGEHVLDNTAGSGTTAIAAENTGRRWTCIERDEDYYIKAVARVLDLVSL